MMKSRHGARGTHTRKHARAHTHTYPPPPHTHTHTHTHARRSRPWSGRRRSSGGPPARPSCARPPPPTRYRRDGGAVQTMACPGPVAPNHGMPWTRCIGPQRGHGMPWPNSTEPWHALVALYPAMARPAGALRPPARGRRRRPSTPRARTRRAKEGGRLCKTSAAAGRQRRTRAHARTLRGSGRRRVCVRDGGEGRERGGEGERPPLLCETSTVGGGGEAALGRRPHRAAD